MASLAPLYSDLQETQLLSAVRHASGVSCEKPVSQPGSVRLAEIGSQLGRGACCGIEIRSTATRDAPKTVSLPGEHSIDALVPIKKLVRWCLVAAMVEGACATGTERQKQRYFNSINCSSEAKTLLADGHVRRSIFKQRLECVAGRLGNPSCTTCGAETRRSKEPMCCFSSWWLVLAAPWQLRITTRLNPQ